MINARMAEQALINANNDYKKAYTQYIILHYRNTGRFAPGFNNKDLQKYYLSLETTNKGNNK